VEALTLQEIFVRYCRYGSLGPQCESRNSMTGPKFLKFLQDADLCDQLGNQREVIFTTCVENDSQRMQFEEFLQALGLVAVGVFPNEDWFEKSVRKLLEERIFLLVDDVNDDLKKGRQDAETESIETSDPIVLSPTSMAPEGIPSPYPAQLTSPPLLCNHPWTEDMDSMTTGTRRTVEECDRPQEETQTVQLDEDDVSLLRAIYDQYALHWCSGRGGKGKALMKESKLRLHSRFKWANYLCFGGFQTFSLDFQLAASNSPEVLRAFRNALRGCDRDSLSFTQFMSAASMLAAYRSSCHLAVSFKAAVRQLLDNCERNMVRECDRKIGECICKNPELQIQINRAWLPFEIRTDHETIDTLESARELLRNIFVYYSDLDRDETEPCRAGSCGDGPVPMLSENSFVVFAKEFDMCPHFLSELQLRRLFQAIQKVPKSCSTAKPMYGLRIDFHRFVGLVGECALKGLSRYPHSRMASTACEKLELLLKKMEVSKGWTILFEDCIHFEIQLEEMKISDSCEKKRKPRRKQEPKCETLKEKRQPIVVEKMGPQRRQRREQAKANYLRALRRAGQNNSSSKIKNREVLQPVRSLFPRKKSMVRHLSLDEKIATAFSN